MVSVKNLSLTIIFLSNAALFGSCTDVLELVKRISGINENYNLDETQTSLPLDQFMASEMTTNYGAPSISLCGGDALSKFPRFRPALDMYRSEFDDVLGEAEIVSKHLSQTQKWKSYFNEIREIYPIVLSAHDNNKLSALEKRFYRYYGTKNVSYVVDYHRVAQRFDNQTVGRVLIMKKPKKIIVSLRVPAQTGIKMNDIHTFHKDIYALALRSQAAIVSLLLDRTGNNKTALHEYELIFTGFGQGGSLATLASTFMYLDSSMNYARCGLNSNFHNQIKLVTFGASMVFSANAALNFPLRPENHWRFMHPDHKFTPLVPGLPLKHVGVEVKAPELPFNNLQLMKSGRGYFNNTIIDEIEDEMKKERLQILKELDERNLRFANMMNFPKDSAAKRVKQMLVKKISESWFLFDLMEKGSDVEVVQSILSRKTSKNWEIPGLYEMYSQIMSSKSLSTSFKMEIYEAFVKSSPWENEAKGFDARSPSLDNLPEKSLMLDNTLSQANQCDPAKLSNLLSSFFNVRNVHPQLNNITSFNVGKSVSNGAIFSNDAGVTCVTAAGGKGLEQHKINCYYIPIGSSDLKSHAFNVFQFSGFGSKKECYEKGSKLGSLYTGSMTQAESCFQSNVANVFNRPSFQVSLNDHNLFKVSNQQSQCFEMTSSILGSEKCFLTTNSGFEPLLKLIKSRPLDNVLWKAYKVPADLINSEVCQKYSLAAYWHDLAKEVAAPSHQLNMQVEMGFLSAFPFTSLFRGYKVARLATRKYRAGLVSNFNMFSFMESSTRADNNDLPLPLLHKTYFPLLETVPQTLFHMCVNSDIVPWIDCTRKENQAFPNLCPSYCDAIEFENDPTNSGRHLFCRKVKACRGALAPGSSLASTEAKVLFVSFEEAPVKEMDPNSRKSVRQFFKALSDSKRPNTFQDHQVFIELEESYLSSSDVFTKAAKSSVSDGNRKRAFLSFSFMDQDLKSKKEVDAEKKAVAQGDIRYKKFDWLNYVALARARGVQQIVYPTIIESSLERNAESLDRIIKLILKSDISPEVPNFLSMSQEQINKWKEDRIAEYAYKASETPVVKDEIPELSVITLVENFALQNKSLNISIAPSGASDTIRRNALMRKVMMTYIYSSIRSLCVMFSIFKTGNQDFDVSELKDRVEGLDKLIYRVIYDSDIRDNSEDFHPELEYEDNAKFVVQSVLSLLELTESDIFLMHEIDLTLFLIDRRHVFLDHFKSYFGASYKAAEFSNAASLIFAAVFFDLDRIEPVGVLEAMAFQNVVSDFAYKALLTAYGEGTPENFTSLGTESLSILGDALEAVAIPKLLETQIYNGEFIMSTISINKIAKAFSSKCQEEYKNSLADAKKMKDTNYLKELENNKPKCLDKKFTRLNDAFKKIMQSRATFVHRKQLYSTLKRKTISYLLNGLHDKEFMHVMNTFDEVKGKGKVTILPMPSELSNQGIMTYINFGKTMGLALEFSYVLIYRDTGSDLIHLGLRMKFSMLEHLQKNSGKIAHNTIRLGLVALKVAVMVHTGGFMLHAPPFLQDWQTKAVTGGWVAKTCVNQLSDLMLNPHTIATNSYAVLNAIHASVLPHPGFKASSKEGGINFSFKSYVTFNSMILNEEPLNEYLRSGNMNTMNNNVDIKWIGIKNVDLRLINFRSIHESCRMLSRLEDSTDLDSVLEKWKGKLLSAKVRKMNLQDVLDLALGMAPDKIGMLDYGLSLIQVVAFPKN